MCVRTFLGHTPGVDRARPDNLLSVSPVALPRRVIALARAAAGCEAALYVIDIDGSCLIRLAGDERTFPERVMAPVGVGPEIAIDRWSSLQDVCTSRMPTSVAVPLVLRDRAIGALVCERPPAMELRSLAEQAAMALELTSGYTDVVHAARRRKEIRPAAEIQQNLLPPRLATIDGDEIAGGVLPGYEVAGDFFDYAANPDGLWLCVADAMGKGNEAAALASLAVGAIRAARRGGATLEQAATLVDDTVALTEQHVRFLTAILAQWHAPTSTFRWITAGHPPPLLLSADGAASEMAGVGTYPLGLTEDHREFAVNERRLRPGDRILLYSDGVTELRRADDTLFGLEGLSRLLGAAQPRSAAALVRAIQDGLLDASPKPLRDDATMLLLSPGPRSG